MSAKICHVPLENKHPSDKCCVGLKIGFGHCFSQKSFENFSAKYNVGFKKLFMKQIPPEPSKTNVLPKAQKVNGGATKFTERKNNFGYIILTYNPSQKKLLIKDL